MERPGLNTTSSPEFPPRKKFESPAEIRTEDEELLMSRRAKGIGKLESGVTESARVELENDGEAVFKIMEGYKNERIAYLLDHIIGFNLVPTTVIRTLVRHEGSFQRHIDAPTSEQVEYEVTDELEVQLMKMWVLDLMIGNMDRHSNNFLVKGNRVYAVDHEASNPSSPIIGLESGFDQFYDEQLDDEVVQILRNFLERSGDQKILHELLAELTDEPSAERCMKRVLYISELVVQNGMLTERDILNFYTEPDKE